MSGEQAGPSGPALRAEDIRAGYGAGDIVHGVSVVVAPGTVASVVGPNGSGKSTLLKALTGVIRPSSGRVLVGDRDVTGLPPEEVARAGVGYVPQTDDIFAPLTVRENLEMGGYLLTGHKVSKQVERVVGIFPKLGLPSWPRMSGLGTAQATSSTECRFRSAPGPSRPSSDRTDRANPRC